MPQPAPTEPSGTALCIKTSCRSVEDFISLFEQYVSGYSVFVGTSQMIESGSEVSLVLLLDDGTPVLRGRATVVTGWSTSENTYQLPGLLLRLRTLSARSKAVFDRIQRRTTPRADAEDGEAAFIGNDTTMIGPPLSDRSPVPPRRAATQLLPPMPAIPPVRPRALTITIPPVARPASAETIATLHTPLGRRELKQTRQPLASPEASSSTVESARPAPPVEDGVPIEIDCSDLALTRRVAARRSLDAPPPVTTPPVAAALPTAPRRRIRGRAVAWAALPMVVALGTIGVLRVRSEAAPARAYAPLAAGCADTHRLTRASFEIDGKTYVVSLTPDGALELSK